MGWEACIAREQFWHRRKIHSRCHASSIGGVRRGVVWGGNWINSLDLQLITVLLYYLFSGSLDQEKKTGC